MSLTCSISFIRGQVREVDLSRLDARMPQVLRDTINACAVAKSLDGIKVAKVVKSERHPRCSPPDGFCKGRRNRTPWPVRGWKDPVACSRQPADMIEGGWRQRNYSAPVSLGLENFEGPRGFVELRPFERNQLGLPRTSESRRNRKITQGWGTLNKHRLNRRIIRQDDWVAPLAQESNCIEGRITISPTDRLRISQHTRNCGEVPPHRRNPDIAPASGDEFANGSPIKRSNHPVDQKGLTQSQALPVSLIGRRRDLPFHMLSPSDNRIRPFGGAMSRLRLNDPKPRIAKSSSLSHVRCMERLTVLSSRDFRAEIPSLVHDVHIKLAHGLCPLLCPVGARRPRFSRITRARNTKQLQVILAGSAPSSNWPIRFPKPGVRGSSPLRDAKTEKLSTSTHAAFWSEVCQQQGSAD